MSILDSRDLEEELNNPDTDEERKKAIQELKKETENYGWEDGICFVSEMEWRDYCQNFAEDVGYLESSINGHTNPLHYCIDWDEWSNKMAMDYSQSDFEGTTYYWREA
jgi:hypothetical protein